MGVNIFTQTVRNRLRQSGIWSRRACIRIPLSRLHKQARLNWAHDHVNWTDNDWDPYLFTDESRYCLYFTDRRARMWRKRGGRFQDANISEHNRYGGGSIMVWAGTSGGGRTDLHIVMRGVLSWTSTSERTLVQSEFSSSSWTTTLDLIAPGWVRSTSSRRPSYVWTGQHTELISTRSSMLGTCYRWRFCVVRSSKQLSWNWEMPSL